jgi:class 3 adenylate cyclase
VNHVSLYPGHKPNSAGRPHDGGASAPGRATAQGPARPEVLPDDDRGALRRGSLRFVNETLERDYQRQAGAESLTGFRITTGVAAVMWLLASAVIPSGTAIPLDRAMPVCAAMAVFNLVAFLGSGWAATLDRQHSIVAVLTSVNGLVVLWLAFTGNVLPGYGISALMLLFAFGFVSRTGFIFAVLRSAVIVVGFVVAAVLYPGPGNLLVDAFIFGGSVIGTLVALRLLEQSRRRVFFQDIVITQQAEALSHEKARADELLRNVLPASISTRLLAGERTIADAYPSVTVLFADIVGFTPLTARLPADELVSLLGRLFSRFDELVAARGLEKIKTVGDAYMAAGGLPEPLDDHAARVVDLGLAMIDAAAQEGQGMANLRLRVGVHSGPVIGGVIGHRKFAFDMWGETVNIASRLESQGIIGRVQVSDATWQLVKDRFEGQPRGTTHLRGYGPLDAYIILGRRREGSERHAVDLAGPGTTSATTPPAPTVARIVRRVDPAA